MGILWLFVDVLLFPHGAVKLISNVVVVVVNYVLSKFIIFRKKPAGPSTVLSHTPRSGLFYLPFFWPYQPISSRIPMLG